MEYLGYLDYTLKRLSEKFSVGLNLSDLPYEYKKITGEWIDSETQKHFESLYNNTYFESMGNYKHKILPEVKTIIDKYGSLSAYLELCEIERNKKENEETELKKLQVKNLELQNDNLKYSETLREKELRIVDLELKIKGIELIKQYWWFIGLCIFAGGLLKEPLDILITYMKQLIQSTQILHG